MKRQTRKNIRNTGFTLIEITISIAILMIIVSVVYGTYFATSQSVLRCNRKIVCSTDARSVLTRMTRQIRCAYRQAAPKKTPTVSSINHTQSVSPDDSPIYLAGGAAGDDAGNDGIILRLITTAPIFHEQDSSTGLFEAAYKYDSIQGILSYSQRKYIPEQKNSTTESGAWLPIAENVESIELSFYDGRRWHDKWNSRDDGKLPHTVKTNIVFADENSGSTSFSTAAHVNCHQPAEVYIAQQKPQ